MQDVHSYASSTISYRKSLCFLKRELCKNILFFECDGELPRLLIVSPKKSKALFYRRFIHNPLESVTPNKYMLCTFCINQVNWQFKLNILELYALLNVPDQLTLSRRNFF